MNRTIATLAIFLVILFGSLPWSLAQETKFSLDGILTPEQQRAMGLHKLTRSEKLALTRFIIKVFGAGMEVCFDAGLNAPVSNGPRRNPPENSSEQHDGSDMIYRLKSNIGSGTFLVLDDSSIWEVNRVGRADAMLWHPESEIIVIENSGRCLYGEFLLMNGDDGGAVCARPIEGE